MSSTFVLELRDKRAKLITAANEITVAAAKDKRSMSAQEAETWDKIHAETETLAKDIDRLEKQEAANRSIEHRTPRITPAAGGSDPEQAAEDKALRNLAIQAWVRGGIAGMPAEQQRAMATMYNAEVRDQSAGTNSTGGYTVAPDTSMYAAVVESMKAFGVDENLFEVVTTTTGASLLIPTNDDTANVTALVAENADSGAATDITFGQVSVSAYVYGTGALKASNQFLQDSAIPVDAWIGRKLGERAGRKKANLLTVGTGSSQPQGVVVGAAAGKTAAGAAAITYAELLDLKYAVDPAYRKNARYMMKDSTVQLLKKLVDGSSRPLWQPGLTAGIAGKAELVIDGDPVVVNQDMPAATTGLKSVLYGDFKQFLVRNVLGFSVQRLVERYAEFNQVGFVGFHRFDSKILNSAAIKYLIQA